MRKNIKIFVIAIVLIICSSNKCFCQNTNPVANIGSESIYVFDAESILSANEKQKLLEKILLFKQKSQKEIFVVTTDSIGYFKDMQEYATYLRWNYDNVKKSDDVLIIAVSKIMKSVGISTGNNIQKTLTNEICEDIINKKMIPEFKKGNFFEGLEQAINEIQLIFY